MQIVFTSVGYIKLDHLSREMCYTNCVKTFKKKIYIYIYSPPPMPPHVLMNFRDFPSGCGDSVADF